MTFSRSRETGPTLVGASALEPCTYNSGKLQLLSAMDILKDLSGDQIEDLMDKTPMRTAARGTLIYGPDNPEVLFLLKAGQVELYRQSSDGRKLTLALVGERTFFGEMSLIDLHLEDTYAIAREDSVICILSRYDLEQLMLELPRVALRICEVLAQRLQGTRVLLQEMAFNDLTGRVVNLLLRLASEDTNVVEGYSHEELAAMVGCQRESFTVVLDRFKNSKAVEVARRRIIITDPVQLHKVMQQRLGSLSG